MSDRVCYNCEGETGRIKLTCSECGVEYCYTCMENKYYWRCHRCYDDVICCDVNVPLKKKRARDDAKVEVESWRGRTGPQRPKIDFNISNIDDKLVKIRIDDTENPEFWIEGVILKKTLTDFIEKK